MTPLKKLVLSGSYTATLKINITANTTNITTTTTAATATTPNFEFLLVQLSIRPTTAAVNMMSD